MRLVLIAPATVLLVACGSSDEGPSNLEAAAAQSDPAAAAVLNEAAESGMNEQQALNLAGQAQVANAQEAANRPPSGSVQAVPNTVQTPNRPDGSRPPAKGTGSTNVPGMQMGGEQKQPQPSG